MTEEEDHYCTCGAPASWMYAPACDWPEEDKWTCDECVPRDCEFCNSDDDTGVPLPKPWEPCVEWFHLSPENNPKETND